MYAITPASLVYHLVSDLRTLCGLFVVGELRLVSNKPSDRILCRHCEKVLEERAAGPAPTQL